jgi:hypothetical protein
MDISQMVDGQNKTPLETLRALSREIDQQAWHIKSLLRNLIGLVKEAEKSTWPDSVRDKVMADIVDLVTVRGATQSQLIESIQEVVAKHLKENKGGHDAARNVLGPS